MPETDPRRLVRPEVRALRGYPAPGPETSGVIKLDANESPYPLPASVRERIDAALAEAALHRYPDPDARALRRAVGECFGVDPAQVLVGNGSDELLHILTEATAGPGRPVLAPVPTFVVYEMAARIAGAPFVGVPLADGFALDREALLRATAEARPAIVFLAYPNNPTGNCFDAGVIQEVLEAASGLVVVDEAYVDYSGRTFLSRLARHPHLVILRTLSKMGLAGVRLGILVGDTRLVAELDKVRQPYNVNVLTQTAARIALEERAALAPLTEAVRRERGRVFEDLSRLPGIQPFPSDANFVLFRPAAPAEEVLRGLAQEGILIRDFSRTPGLANCLRVTIGTPEENGRFLEALERVLAAAGARA